MKSIWKSKTFWANIVMGGLIPALQPYVPAEIMGFVVFVANTYLRTITNKAIK